jgi:hypothetical protein
MADTLFIAFDLFHAASYVPRKDANRPSGYAKNDESYAHDEGRFYAVLQPFLIGTPSITDYLASWDKARLSQPGALTFLDENVITNVIAPLPADTPVTPVPFPRDATLELHARWANNGKFDVTRDLGGGSTPFAFPMNLWPEFAARNFMPVPIRKFAHLSAAQVEQLFTWAYGLMQTLERKKASLTAAEQRIYDDFFKDKPADALEGDLAAWRKILVTDGKLAILMDRLWHDRTLVDESTLNPPGFRYTSDQLMNGGLGLSVFETAPETTYHRSLIEQLKTLKPEDAMDALRRYFGFGERLRFPKKVDPALEADFMVVQTGVENVPNWFVTNAQSMLGQVFRIGPVSNSLAALGFQLDGLKICGTDILSNSARAAIAQQFDRAFLEAKNNAASHAVFGASVKPDPDGDRVWFMPRNARPQDTQVKHPDSQKALFSVPGSLLDMLDPNVRANMPEGKPDGDLAEQNPQRTLIATKEILGDGNYAQWDKSRRHVRVKMNLERVPLAGAPANAVAYKLTLAREPHVAEKNVILGGLQNLGPSSAAVWVSQSANGSEILKSFPLAGKARLLDPATLLVLDADGSLTKLLPVRGTNEDATKKLPQEKVAVDFVFLAGNGAVLGAAEMFNVLTQEDAGTPVPLIILAREFEHRVSRSADRLAERFGLRLDPAPPFHKPGDLDSDSAHPILGHFANFNKLRLDLVSGASVVKLNFPDAMLPLPKQSAEEPHKTALAGADYSYWLTHQFSEEVRQTLADTEEARYLAYGTAGTKWLVAGQVEHQYSHKMPVDGSSSVQLPLSSDLRNLAALSVSIANNKVPLFAVSFDLTPAPETIRITLDPEYLKNVTAAARETPASLRPLYEALFDLREAALSAGAEAAVLRLERWNFDNSKNPPAAQHVSDPDSAIEFPSIEKNMRFGGAAERRVTASDAKPFTDLLGATFSAFAANVKNQTLPLKIDLKLDNSWQWSGADPNKVLPLSSTTNVIRLALRLGRAEARAIGDEYLQSDGQFLPLLIAKDADADSPELKSANLQTLASAALENLRERIQAGDSPLRTSFGWIRSKDVSRDAQVHARPDEDRELKLLGESYLFLNFPDGLAAGIDQVVRLFHVPYAFTPVAGHPGFGDPQTTLEFTEFILNVLASLRRGVKPEEIDLKNETDLDASFRLRTEIDELIGGPNGIAGRLLQLLARVDPPAVQDPLFAHVDSCIANIDAVRKDVMQALLASDAGLFSAAKAIAAGVFDPQTWSDKLFALQVRKRIREGLVASSQVADDSDRFSCARFFGSGDRRFIIDVLDDQSYDDDYHIDENEYASVKPRIEPRRRNEVTKRGDAAARTAEDVLEAQNLLNDTGINRSVLAEVVHYNPEWAVTSGGTTDRRYLLPSRRFPRAPKPVLPRTARTTRLIAQITANPDLPAQFAQQIAAVMNKEVGIISSSGTLTLRPSVNRRAVARPEQADGWYRLDSYLSHYYFVVEPDEETLFDNDVFGIVVERSSEPFLPEAPVPETSFKEVTDLQRWFVYHRRREEAVANGGEGDAQKVERPSTPLTLRGIIDESRQWLTAKTPAAPFHDTLLLEQQQPVTVPASTATFSRGANGWVLENMRNEKLGNVVAADLMTIGDANDRRAVLHLAVLDDAWKYQRVRVQILRNGLDVNGNKTIDLNPVFRLLSRASEWVDYGRDVVSLHAVEDQFPTAVATLRPVISLSDWLAASSPANFGPIVRTAAETTFTSNGTALPFWNLSEIVSSTNNVSGVVLQVIPDVHPRQQGSTPASSGHAARGDVLTKQILRATTADKSGELTKEMHREEILAARPQIRVIWSNAKNKVPLLEVTWPIAWS